VFHITLPTCNMLQVLEKYGVRRNFESEVLVGRDTWETDVDTIKMKPAL
jgi:hypothetical protein